MRSCRRPLVVMLAVVMAAACTREPAMPDADPAAVPSASSRERREARPMGPLVRPGSTALPSSLDAVATASDTFDSLVTRYGRADVERGTLPGAEGAQVQGWLLFPRDAARRIEVLLDEAGVHPAMLLVRNRSSWARSDGVEVGLDLHALEALNGEPFAFSGFDWDYGGFVTDWKGGRLDHDGRFLGPVRLCPPASTPAGYPVGDGEFMSDAAAVRAVPPVVCEVGVALGTRAD